MDRQILAILIQEGSRFFSQYLRFRTVKTADQDPLVIMENKSKELSDREVELIQVSTPNLSQVTIEEKPQATKEKPMSDVATAVPTGCVPCALGHYGACTGMINEAVRFGRDDGMTSNEVLDRVGMCMDELNAMERKDLRPQMINGLPEWEKELAEKALTESRAIRHKLEGLKDVTELEEVAGTIQTTRQELYRNWAKRRLKNMSPEEKTEMTTRILTKLEAEE